MNHKLMGFSILCSSCLLASIQVLFDFDFDSGSGFYCMYQSMERDWVVVEWWTSLLRSSVHSSLYYIQLLESNHITISFEI